ncbi:MAG: polysaccharide pyruvyl transferase family protein [Balneolales bacterium]
MYFNQRGITSRLRRLLKKNSALPPDVGWFEEKGSLPRAIVQVSPGVQPNGVFVNYGDQLMFWALQEALTSQKYEVLYLPRTAFAPRKLKRQRADIFIDLGGFIYSGSHHRGMKSIEAANVTQQNAQACKRAGAFVTSAPQTYGPFSGRRNGPLAKGIGRMINKFDTMYVRDPASLAHLCEVNPDVKNKAQIAPDIAFLYRSDAASGRALLKQAGLDTESGRPIAGIIPNRQISQRSSTYLKDMKRVIGFLKTGGAQVVLIPHERGRKGVNEKDDRYLCRILAEESGVTSLASEKPAAYPSAKEEYRYIRGIEDVIGALDFLVSGRFHGALRGLAEAVPTVAFSWAHKYPPLFSDLTLPPDEFIIRSSGHTLETLAAAWQGRSGTKEVLERTVPDIRNRARRFVDEIIALANHR